MMINLFRSLTKNVGRGAVLPSILMILIGLVFLSIMNMLIKQLGTYGYQGSFLAFMRNVTAVMVALTMLWGAGYFTAKKRHHLNMPRFKLLFLRGFFIIASQTSFFTALHYIELGLARALSYTSSIFVTILAMVLLKEKCGIWRGSAIIIGLIGTFLVMGEGASLEIEKLPFYLLTILSAITFACAITTLSFFPKSDNNLVLVTYAQIVATILGAFALTFIFEWQVINNLRDLFLMLLSGLFGTFGVLCISFAYRMSQASLLASFQYFGLLYALFFGWVFFGENPLDKLFPGALLIVGAGIVIAVREAIKKIERPHQEGDSKI